MPYTLLEDEKAKIPRPTELENIELSKGEFAEEGKTIVSLVDADSEEYRRQLEDCSKFNIKKLKDIMVNICHNMANTAERYGVKGNYVVGANIAGFEKVVDAMNAQGIV